LALGESRNDEPLDKTFDDGLCARCGCLQVSVV
jgi:hypothetical protein